MATIIIVPTVDPDLEIVIEDGEHRYNSIALQRRSSGEIQKIEIPDEFIPWFHQIYPDGAVSVVCFDRQTNVDWNFEVDLETRELVRFAPFSPSPDPTGLVPVGELAGEVTLVFRSISG